jgi:hypothetical protein
VTSDELEQRTASDELTAGNAEQRTGRDETGLRSAFVAFSSAIDRSLP